MVDGIASSMGERRALLTDREREIISGEADVDDSYRYQTISRVRRRFDRLEDDLEIFREHGDLLDELRDVVCTDDDARPAAPDPEPAPEEDRGAPDTAAEPQGADTDDDLLEDLRAYLDTEGRNPKTAHGRGAVVDVVAYLREHGTAKTADLKAAVYPNYESEWGGQRGMWESISRYLDDVPGVEKAGYGEYKYTSDDAVRAEIGDDSSDVYDPTEEF
jgi:hypothetical protein